MSHREELLEQLKKIRLEWFRSAANLDYIIANLERDLEDPKSHEIGKVFDIRAMRNYRNDSAKVYGWDEIFKLENVVWQQLIETKGES